MKQLFITKAYKVTNAINGERNLYHVAVESGLTYSHTFKLIKLMEENRFVKIKDTKRDKIPALTLKGQRIASLLYELNLILDKTK